MTTESGSINGILESLSADALKEKLNRLDALLKDVDERSKQPLVYPAFQTGPQTIRNIFASIVADD